MPIIKFIFEIPLSELGLVIFTLNLFPIFKIFKAMFLQFICFHVFNTTLILHLHLLALTLIY